MYARGILFGKMKYELGDHSFVRCPEQNLIANIEFKTKGYFGGTYNAIGGVIKNEKTGETLFELSGMWSGEMTIKSMAVRCPLQPCRQSYVSANWYIRLERRSSSLMPHMRNTRLPSLVPSKNKKIVSRRSCGIKQ